MSNTVIDALKNRRSIRKFKKVQITDEELKTVLEAGTWAPTAMGFQDPWIVAVQNPELMEKIAKTQAELLQTAIDKWREEELAKINENPSAYIKTTNS